MKKLLLIFLCAGLCSCAVEDVRNRQQAISNAHDQMLQRRSERIKARDQRMQDSREVWFQ